MYSIQEYFGSEGWFLAERFKQICRDGRSVDPIIERTDKFAETRGRRPRALVTALGRNGKDPEAMAMVTRLAEKGFDVDLCPKLRRPLFMARMAVENDVHVICLANLEYGRDMLSRLTDALQTENGRHILVACTGQTPPSNGKPGAVDDVTVCFDFDAGDDAVNNVLDALEQGG